MKRIHFTSANTIILVLCLMMLFLTNCSGGTYHALKNDFSASDTLEAEGKYKTEKVTIEDQKIISQLTELLNDEVYCKLGTYETAPEDAYYHLIFLDEAENKVDEVWFGDKDAYTMYRAGVHYRLQDGKKLQGADIEALWNQ